MNTELSETSENGRYGKNETLIENQNMCQISLLVISGWGQHCSGSQLNGKNYFHDIQSNFLYNPTCASALSIVPIGGEK